MNPSESELLPEKQDMIDATPEAAGSNLEEEASSNNTITPALPSSNDKTPAAPPPKRNFKWLVQRYNIYLLLFILVLLVAGGILTVAYFQNQKNSNATIKAQNLSQSTLQQLAASDATVGSSQQVLNIQSNAVFSGKVLARDGLDVAGTLNVSGTLAVADLTVSGSSQFGQVQIGKDLAVAGNIGIQGSLTAKSLQIAGSGNFSGPISAPQVTTTSLQLNGDLVLTHHISVGGPSPSLSNGPALGSGGTANISGSDTSGSVSINIGSSAASGCFATITFASKYNATPHVLLTPIGSSAAGLAYYVTRTTTSFSICDASAPPASTSFGFDYFITD